MKSQSCSMESFGVNNKVLIMTICLSPGRKSNERQEEKDILMVGRNFLN